MSEARDDTRGERSLTDILAQGEWEKRDWDSSPMLYDRDLARAVGWECHTCGGDAGWPEVASAREYDAETLIYVYCGKCGSEQVYDANGMEMAS